MKPRPYNRPPGDLSRRNRSLIAMHDWEIVTLEDLPIHYKKALVAHGIWPKELREFSEKHPAEFILKVWRRTKKFGVVYIPIEMMKLIVMNDPDRRNDFDTFNEYHNYFKKVEPVPTHPANRLWPIIPSGRGRERETILDGWHRFHAYVDANVKKIPILWYADE
jgi:hypothetical protein